MLTRPHRNARYSSRNVVAAVAIVLFAAGSIAKAANQTFLPAAGDYGTAANWSGSVIPGNGNNDEPQIGWNLSPRVATYSTATNYTTTDRIVVGLGSGNGTLIMNGAA
ncbi:MAG: hypothetical protein KDA41_22775, partial [Planctomycetales bacterium]|nr:hypothetical protein [Planctomycetales bacterium]